MGPGCSRYSLTILYDNMFPGFMIFQPIYIFTFLMVTHRVTLSVENWLWLRWSDNNHGPNIHSRWWRAYKFDLMWLMISNRLGWGMQTFDWLALSCHKIFNILGNGSRMYLCHSFAVTLFYYECCLSCAYMGMGREIPNMNNQSFIVK